MVTVWKSASVNCPLHLIESWQKSEKKSIAKKIIKGAENCNV